jgi:8-oxo-dGTP pyrophosphatase MutT (NUDIX family)
MDEHERDSEPSPRQAAVVPVRRTGGSRVEVCLIRRKGSSKWGIPKGFIDPGNTREQAALTEAREEAGLTGHLVGESIGTYEYKKWGLRLTVAVFLMEVLEEQSTWQEMRFRERRWFSVEDAYALLEDHRVWPLLGRLRTTKLILKSLAAER